MARRQKPKNHIVRVEVTLASDEPIRGRRELKESIRYGLAGTLKDELAEHGYMHGHTDEEFPHIVLRSVRVLVSTRSNA